MNDYRLLTIKRFEKDLIDKTRHTRYRNIVYKENEHLHAKPRDALKFIQCPNVDGYNVPHLKCILRTCKKCPKYRFNDEESKPDDERPYIKFHIFEIVPSCLIHLTQPMDAIECIQCSNLPKQKG